MSFASLQKGSRVDVGLGIVRVVLGVIFAAHGAQKLFVYGIDGVVGSFAQMGAPFPGVSAPLVALVEFFGGIAIALGLLTRVAAVGVALVMVGAIMLVHIHNGFFAPGGVEFALMLLAAAVATAVMGPGAYSLDALRSGRMDGLRQR